MVGRFVKHQEVGLLHQQPGQMRTHDPTAGQRASGTIVIGIPERQSLQNPLGLGHEGTVEATKLIAVQMAGRQFENAFLAHGSALLRQKADGRAALAGDSPRSGFLLTQDELEQRGFPGAVRTHQAQPVGPIDGQRDVLKEGSPAIRFSDFRESKHRRSARVKLRQVLGEMSLEQFRMKIRPFV